MSHRSIGTATETTPDITWGHPIAARPRRRRMFWFSRWWMSLLAAGALLGACNTPAHADVSVEAAAYASANAGVICDILELDPTLATVEDIVIAMFRDGLTPTQAGEVLPLAVLPNCPEYGYVLDDYINKWAPETPSTAGPRIAGGIGAALR